MYKHIKLFVFTLIIFLAACSFGKKYDNDEIVAKVRGEDITLGDVRFLYEDNEIEDGITLAIYIELTKQEVEALNLDITEMWEYNSSFVKDLPPKSEASDYDLAKWEFAEKQAKKFDMDPNEYYLQYMEISMKEISYLETYLNEIIGDPENNDEAALEAYNVEVNQVLETLYENYEDEIDIFY